MQRWNFFELSDHESEDTETCRTQLVMVAEAPTSGGRGLYLQHDFVRLTFLKIVISLLLSNINE